MLSVISAISFVMQTVNKKKKIDLLAFDSSAITEIHVMDTPRYISDLINILDEYFDV
jgi:hypothetical protein